MIIMIIPLIRTKKPNYILLVYATTVAKCTTLTTSSVLLPPEDGRPKERRGTSSPPFKGGTKLVGRLEVVQPREETVAKGRTSTLR